MNKDLIKILSGYREEMLNEKTKEIDLNLDIHDLGSIICALKIYKAFDDILDEEIKIKHSRT